MVLLVFELKSILFDHKFYLNKNNKMIYLLMEKWIEFRSTQRRERGLYDMKVSMKEITKLRELVQRPCTQLASKQGARMVSQ